MDANEPLARNETQKADLPKGILILGAAKSGTTGLFYAIQNALSVGYDISVAGLFEPRRANDVKVYCRTSADQIRLVKMLLGPLGRDEYDFVTSFDKKVVIFRDPRDNVVSRIHFMLTKFINWREKDKVQQVLQLFAEKEKRPDDVSVLGILRGMERISGRENLAENVRTNSILPAQFKRSHGESFHMMPYDELVNGQFDRLSGYLGFHVQSDFEVAGQHAYVVRSKNSGAWRDWFLDEDVQFFARDVADEFRLLGFDPEAKPNDKRQVDPQKTSGYVKAMFDRLEEKSRGKRTERRNNNDNPATRAASEVPSEVEPRALAAATTSKDLVARQAKRKRRNKQQASGAEVVEAPELTAVKAPRSVEARQAKRERRRSQRAAGSNRTAPRAPVAASAAGESDSSQGKRERRRNQIAGAADPEARRAERRQAKRTRRMERVSKGQQTRTP